MTPQPGNELHVGGLEIRASEGVVVIGGRVVALSGREVALLAALASRSGRVIRREDLYRLVWDQPLRPGDRSIDVYVHKLRTKLEEALPERQYIHTHVGFGYRFDPVSSQNFHDNATESQQADARHGMSA